MRNMITTEKPIRYVANDNPGVWVDNLTETGLVTVSCLCMPIQNEFYNFCTDGLFITIERFPKGDYLFDGYYEEPIRERTQTREVHRGKNYEEALAASQAWLEMMLEKHKVMIQKYYPEMYAGAEIYQLTLF